MHFKPKAPIRILLITVGLTIFIIGLIPGCTNNSKPAEQTDKPRETQATITTTASTTLSTTATYRTPVTLDAIPPPPPGYRYPEKLEDIPINLGKYLGWFPSKFVSDAHSYTLAEWNAISFRMTTDGILNGILSTRYNVQTLPSILNVANDSGNYRDVIFIGIYGVQSLISSQYLRSITLGVIPIIAEESNLRTAKFLVDGRFLVPGIRQDSSAVTSVDLSLTWVRVFNIDGVIYYLFIPGGYSNNEMQFNIREIGRPVGILNKNQYLVTEKELSTTNNSLLDFDYYGWMKKNITW